MKGLFVKDIELMKQQKQYFILVIVMGVILNLAGSGSVSFAIGYRIFYVCHSNFCHYDYKL